MDYQAELEFAKRLARKAGDIMRKHGVYGIQVETKDNDTPVTIADNEVNDLILNEIGKAYPDYGILSEEGSKFNNEEYVWVCDPVDGTVAYIHHVPTSAFSLALVKNGKPVMAVAYNPWMNELYSAVEGGGAYCNDNKIHVSKRVLEGARVGSTQTMSTVKAYVRNTQFVGALEGKAQVITVTGIVFAGCLVAGGYLDGRIFLHDGAHDIAAIKLLIEEAGGKVTDLQGNEQRYDQLINGAVISNGLIHEDLLKLV